MNTSPEVEQSPLIQKVRAWDPPVILGVADFRGELTIEIAAGDLVRVAEFLRTEPGLEFNFLSDVCCVDRFPMEPRFELNYHLLSLGHRAALRLRVRVHGGPHPAVDSMTAVWPTANWHEREIFDLFGVRFEGHPDLRRIVMPDDWDGFPLRKDYPVEGFR